jgi:hypothetical protein
MLSCGAGAVARYQSVPRAIYSNYCISANSSLSHPWEECKERAAHFFGLGAFAISSVIRRVSPLVPSAGGFVSYRTEFLSLLALLSNSAGPGASAITFFKIFLSIASLVCLAVAILYFFGKLAIELFGILDGRSPRPSDRYARN